MSIKPHALQDVTGGTDRAVLRGGVLQVEGRDAGAFLQAQLMNDLRPLQDGQWQWNGWLNPSGRVIALCALLRLGAEHWWLLLPDHPAEALAQALQRFVFRSKVVLQPRGELVLRGAMSTPPARAQGAQAALGQDTALLDWSGARPRSLWVGPADEVPPGFDVDAGAWALDDLAHGLPRLGGDQAGEYTPQMLGLERLAAFSVKKGCYPGQEIVARTHFLGRAKRGLRRLATAGPVDPGTALRSEGQAVGTVLCAARGGVRHEALAVLPLDLADGAVLALSSGGDVRCIAFDDGLAR